MWPDRIHRIQREEKSEEQVVDPVETLATSGLPKNVVKTVFTVFTCVCVCMLQTCQLLINYILPHAISQSLVLSSSKVCLESRTATINMT